MYDLRYITSEDLDEVETMIRSCKDEWIKDIDDDLSWMYWK